MICAEMCLRSSLELFAEGIISMKKPFSVVRGVESYGFWSPRGSFARRGEVMSFAVLVDNVVVEKLKMCGRGFCPHGISRVIL